MINSQGCYRATTHSVMRAFDRLPLEVRQALAGAAFNYAAQPFLTQLRRGAPPNRLIERIAKSDAKNLARALKRATP
jgi:hypothetical protein